MRSAAPDSPADETGAAAGFRRLRLSERNLFVESNGPLYGRLDAERFVLGMRVLDRHCNPAGTCHGGMLLTFADMTLIVCSRVQAKLQRYMTTVSLNTDFIRGAPQGAWLEGRADVLRVTRSMVFGQAILSVGGEPVARVSGILKPTGDPDPRFTVERFFGDAD